MIPSVSIQKTDGNLGVASNTDRILVVIGPASAGATNAATPVTSKTDLTTTFQGGPLVEGCAYMIARGLPVVAIRSVATTQGTYGTITSTKTGTATVTAGTSKPDGSYDVIVEILTGGTVGTAGIVFRYSLDGGVNFTGGKSQGTTNTMTLDSGVTFALGAGTFVAGDKWTVTTTGPRSTTSDLTAAFDALKDYTGDWLRVLVLAEADATILAQCASFADSFHSEGKYPEVITNTRPRAATGEDRATYQSAMAAIIASVQSAEVSPCVDQCETVSEVSGRRLRIPQSIPYAARLMLIDDSQDAAAKADGALPNVFLETAAGVRAYHDERRYPGLDVLGFTTLRTWGGRPVSPGVYVNNARVIAGAGSDYRYFQLSAIVNRVIETSFSILQPRLSQSVLLGADGRIRDDVAKSIEESCTAELRTRYADPGRVSGVRLVLSRTDNVLSTDTLTFHVQVQPLGYVKQFIGKVGLVRVLPAN